MKKQTVVNQIEITATGHIQVRMCKQVLDDDGSVIFSEYHRTSVECGGDVVAQMSAVNDHLAEMGWPAVSDAEIASIASHAAVAWTPEKVSAWNRVKEKAAALARLGKAA